MLSSKHNQQPMRHFQLQILRRMSRFRELYRQPIVHFLQDFNLHKLHSLKPYLQQFLINQKLIQIHLLLSSIIINWIKHYPLIQIRSQLLLTILLIIMLYHPHNLVVPLKMEDYHLNFST